MIQKIEIHNFRCFEETKISGFKRVNLIGGKNNSGKTALLEALYLNCSPSVNSIMSFMRFRKENMSFIKALPQKAWDNFFYNHNKQEKAIIVTINDRDDFTYGNRVSRRNMVKYVTLLCEESIEQLDITKNDDDDDENASIADSKIFLSDDKLIKSKLHISMDAEIVDVDGILSEKAFIEAHSEGITSQYPDLSSNNNVHFIPASSRIDGDTLSELYDKASLKGHSDNILKAIQLIEPLIEQVQTRNIGGANLYLKRENSQDLPISLFGEAISKVMYIILRIINNKNSILLIDEIENGIHHTNQFEFWKMLFKLAKEFDIQIFATTHSGEMIRAFANAGLEESEQGNDDTAAYIELARNPRKDRIVGIVRDVEQLDYAITHEKGVRGD